MVWQNGFKAVKRIGAYRHLYMRERPHQALDLLHNGPDAGRLTAKEMGHVMDHIIRAINLAGSSYQPSTFEVPLAVPSQTSGSLQIPWGA